jgi:DNA helicase HerA-like ATPase
LATQEPKSVDSHVVNNCSTQFFGRLSSPANIQSAEGFLGQSGIVAGLGQGEFCVKPRVGQNRRIAVSLGLSNHAGPADLNEIVALACPNPTA